MLIGLDFDNTIVCYDNAIERLANQVLDLPPNVPRTKLALRDFLRQANREPEWTVFQGSLYGPGMGFAEPFDQVLETMRELRDFGYSLCIVSHRSLRPYAGPAYDLHASARGWVEERLSSHNLINISMTYFYETREQKITAIETLGCRVFLDDLPEVLDDKNFPRACQAVLFDPEGSHILSKHQRLSHWRELPDLLSKIT